MTEPTSNSARLAARPIDEGGTPVEAWTQWRRDFAALDVEDCRTLFLVAAHPDDETLGLGATAAMLSRRGVTVQVVAVTDGEAAYPDDGGDRKELAKLRRHELADAAKALGLPTPVFLRIPDGEVARHERRLSARLGVMLAGFDRGTWCAATWRGDGHPDHEATGRAAADAAKRAGVRFLEYPIWMWHWAIPDDPAVPWHGARRIELTPGDLAAKAEAMRCFASQLERGDGPPLLTPEVVERQMALGEIVFL
ncbi:PIG-L deacetylase family protein [Mycolicibacterium stellerae]|uniref:PIG-L deacetylase family protein n=1 Tax=Mycolicibacterium stellerae TaxID=2358193 RepID=UPI000F0B22E0|nr:PIG-L family deacetylase [Mycolicibacterium stellerae]